MVIEMMHTCRNSDGTCLGCTEGRLQFEGTISMRHMILGASAGNRVKAGLRLLRAGWRDSRGGLRGAIALIPVGVVIVMACPISWLMPVFAVLLLATCGVSAAALTTIWQNRRDQDILWLAERKKR